MLWEVQRWKKQIWQKFSRNSKLNQKISTISAKWSTGNVKKMFNYSLSLRYFSRISAALSGFLTKSSIQIHIRCTPAQMYAHWLFLQAGLSLPNAVLRRGKVLWEQHHQSIHLFSSEWSIKHRTYRMETRFWRLLANYDRDSKYYQKVFMSLSDSFCFVYLYFVNF